MWIIINSCVLENVAKFCTDIVLTKMSTLSYTPCAYVVTFIYKRTLLATT